MSQTIIMKQKNILKKIIIEKSVFGNVTISGQKYRQPIIVGEKIFERDYEMLVEKYGTSHAIDETEIEKLKENSPEIILIATGQRGVLKIPENQIKELEKSGAVVKHFITSVAVKEYNKLKEQGKKINALIHTTC